MSRRVLVTPILHPAAVVRGLWHKEPAQIVYLRRVAEGKELTLDTDLPPPNTLLYPTVDQVCQFACDALQWGAVSMDLETAGDHVICIGMTLVRLDTGELGRTVCVRFRVTGGALYWEKFSDQVQVVAAIHTVVSSPQTTLIFHNGIGFDVPLLLELGFQIEGPLLDTMIMSHAIYSEMPRGLQYLSTLYLGSPVWKKLHDPKDDTEKEANDEE